MCNLLKMSLCILDGFAHTVLSVILGREASHRFTGEAQRGSVICLRSSGWWVAEPGFELRSARLEFVLLTGNDPSQPPSSAWFLDQQHHVACELGKSQR